MTRSDPNLRPARPGAQTPATVRVVTTAGDRLRSDMLATEEPLEIRVRASGGEEKTLAVTMRTPGNDFELAAGFLYGEGVIAERSDFDAIRYCVDDPQQYNVVTVDLRAESLPDLGSLERHFYTTSACGVCGKASLDAIASLGGPPLSDGPVVDADLVLALPRVLREGQALFEKTGGLHAAALFGADGNLLCVREDVGRHNAMDKLVGWGVLDEELAFTDQIVLVSGRASFELLQKALRAGASFFCAVSAPSSLAVDVASRYGMTLVGFLRDGGFNVYTCEQRVKL
jgi:FdhD protein